MIKKAILKSFDSVNHKATVQIVGSLSSWLENVPVSQAIAAADMVAGRSVAVLSLDPGNPADCVVVALWPGVPSGGGGSGTKIQDSDSDTKVDVEESADEDKIRMDVAGTEAFLLSNVGILDLAKQSGVDAYGSVDQYKCAYGLGPTNYARLWVDTESGDPQNELNLDSLTGTADATVAGKLHDTGAFTQAESYYLGMAVWNTTDDTYSKVIGKDSNDQLDIDGNIFVNGETYRLFDSRFTATNGGRYVIAGVGSIGGGNTLPDRTLVIVRIVKNGTTTIGHARAYTSYSGNCTVGCFFAAVADLSANDYIYVELLHTDNGSGHQMPDGRMYRTIGVTKVA